MITPQDALLHLKDTLKVSGQLTDIIECIIEQAIDDLDDAMRPYDLDGPSEVHIMRGPIVGVRKFK